MSELVIDHLALEVWLKTAPELRALLSEIGRQGVDYAKTIAPVGVEGEGGAYSPSRPGHEQRHPGEYRDSLEWTIHSGRSRMSLRVQSKDFKAGWIEKGTRFMPKHAVLARTLDYLKSGG